MIVVTLVLLFYEMSKVTKTMRKYLILKAPYNAVSQEVVDSCDKLRRVHESLRFSCRSLCAEHQQNTDKSRIDLFPLQRLCILCG